MRDIVPGEGGRGHSGLNMKRTPPPLRGRSFALFGGDAGTAGMCFWTCPRRESELHRLFMSKRERERGGGDGGGGEELLAVCSCPDMEDMKSQ